MPSVPLPEDPSLAHLKNQAKFVRTTARRGDSGSLALVEEFHPRAAALDVANLKLTDAQLTIARLHGFPCWVALRNHLSVVDRFRRDVRSATPADAFILQACLSYDPRDPAQAIERAHELLAAAPDLATASLAAAATVGDHATVRRLLTDDPGAARRGTGPYGWPPLLYAAYSRIQADPAAWSLTTTAQVLLEMGADPNAGFLWRGLVPPFTALTGAIGGGERGEPDHPDGQGLARMLLEAGADPNDGQALYNKGLGGPPLDDPAHLILLSEYGLGRDHGGPWYRRLGDQLTPPAALLYDELEVAAVRDYPIRMRWLLDQDLDLSRPVGRARKPVRATAEEAHATAVLALLPAQS
ncbi:hypothetical protein [Euzebya tangerina]|uniref:hypothetical protein n=1 Tax=Euzebya tangerina TaxID=591198 RepID=UPI000E30F23A|nr:hypothetical protein [Euzebya tangerina]